MTNAAQTETVSEATEPTSAPTDPTSEQSGTISSRDAIEDALTVEGIGNTFMGGLRNIPLIGAPLHALLNNPLSQALSSPIADATSEHRADINERTEGHRGRIATAISNVVDPVLNTLSQGAVAVISHLPEPMQAPIAQMLPIPQEFKEHLIPQTQTAQAPEEPAPTQPTAEQPTAQQPAAETDVVETQTPTTEYDATEIAPPDNTPVNEEEFAQTQGAEIV